VHVLLQIPVNFEAKSFLVFARIFLCFTFHVEQFDGTLGVGDPHGFGLVTVGNYVAF